MICGFRNREIKRAGIRQKSQVGVEDWITSKVGARFQSIFQKKSLNFRRDRRSPNRFVGGMTLRIRGQKKHKREGKEE